ncbi:MAG TPA: ATP-grasp domain-containing protein [Bacteroidales bacterium]|nr:ATP-grasp domain-containing protein [Bacteroidales bacterium]
MRCCILYNQPRENALADELDILDQVEWVETNLKKAGIETYRKGITNNFMNEISLLADEKPDFVFNLVESINNKGELLYFIPALLNMHSIPYTGNPLEALFITTSKFLTVKLLKNEGIRTPESFHISEYRKFEPGKSYIIKPVWEDGSLDITQDSVFVYHQGYEEKFMNLRDSHWIIQEYIDGREFNISLLTSNGRPEVLPPAEIVFVDYGNRPRIVDFKAKWEEDSFEYKNTIRRFPGIELNESHRKEIEVTAIKCWDIFSLRGYARIDMRVDSENRVYVIEVNANPCISKNGGFVAATENAGYAFTDVIKRIINDLNR